MAPDERPERLEVAREEPAGARLHEDVAEGGRLDRPGQDRQLAGVRGQLAEERVPGAAADEVDDLDRPAGQAGGVPDRPAVCRG